MFSRNVILSFIDKVTTGTLSLALLISNVALFVSVASVAGKDGFEFGLVVTAAVLDN